MTKRYSIKVNDSKCIELSKPNSSILVYRIPYKLLKEKTHGLELANRFIIYILFGTSSKGKDYIYVGKSKNGIDNRPTAHEKKYANWTDCYILINFKERTFFNDGTIQYIENELRHRIDSLDMFVNTTNQTISGTASPDDEDDCDEYIKEVLDMIHTLGLNLYDTNEVVGTKLKNKDMHSLDKNIQSLYDNLVLTVKDVNSEIEQSPMRAYINFLIDKKIIFSVKSSGNALHIVFNSKIGELIDTMSLLEDVSKVGHNGSGDYRIIIKDNSNFKEIKDYINQCINL